MKRKIISIFMIIIILLNICSFVFAEDSTNTVTNQTLEEQKKEVNDKIETANSKLTYVQNELSTTMLKVQELEDKVTDYKSQMNDLGSRLDTLQK